MFYTVEFAGMTEAVRCRSGFEGMGWSYLMDELVYIWGLDPCERVAGVEGIWFKCYDEIVRTDIAERESMTCTRPGTQ